MNAEFSERPFAAGTLTGLRAFRASDDGTLTGVVYPYDFNNGVNEGICATTFGDKPNHDVGMLDCTCGFYAFFDGSNTYYDKPQYRADTVAAIVEGFGVCTVGGKGFRASKARLVALVAPTPLRVGGLPNTEAVALLSGVLGITSLAVRILTALPRTKWVVGAAVTAATLTSRRITGRVITSNIDFHTVRTRYPNVPVYPSVAAAIAAHPLTVPEPS